MTMRVLQVTPVFEPSVGGVETAVRETTARLGARGVEVEVLTADASRELPRTEVLHGSSVQRVPAWPRGGDQLFAPGIARRVAEGGWDLVHVQCWHTLVAPIAMAAAARARIPYVVTFHAGGHPSALRTALRSTQMQVLRPLLARAAALIATAEWEVERYSELLGIPAGRFVVVPNGATLPEPAEVVREPGTLIVSPGRLERYKGHGRVLEALAHLLEAIPDARLWIAGGGPCEDELRARAAVLGVAGSVEIGAERDRAVYAGRLRQAALGVLLSDFETHPLAAIEVVGLGVPLLVGEDGAGLSEIVAKGQARGIDNGAEPAVHAAAMAALIADPPPAQTVEVLDWDQVVNRLEELYASVLDRSLAPA
jgi:glycosyltransferase involved in cell wall biosynthesis